MQFHQIRRLHLVAAGQPVLFLLGQRAVQKIARGGETQNGQTPFLRAAAMLGQVTVEIFFAQYAINRFSHGGPLTGAQAHVAKIA